MSDTKAESRAKIMALLEKHNPKKPIWPTLNKEERLAEIRKRRFNCETWETIAEHLVGSPNKKSTVWSWASRNFNNAEFAKITRNTAITTGIIAKNEFLLKLNNRHLEASDGHLLTSRAERMIDDTFYNEGINHQPEHPYYSPTAQRRLHPDWTLPDHCCLVEYSEGYPEPKKETDWLKMNAYQADEIKCYWLNEKDLQVLDEFLLKLSIRKTELSQGVNRL